MEWRRCSICISDHEVLCSEEEDGKGRFSNQLTIVYLVHKVLNIPLEECTKYLRKYGNPVNWVDLCSSCSDVLEKAEDVSRTISKLQNKLDRLQNQLLLKMSVKIEDEVQEKEKQSAAIEIRKYLMDLNENDTGNILGNESDIVSLSETYPSPNPKSATWIDDDNIDGVDMDFDSDSEHLVDPFVRDNLADTKGKQDEKDKDDGELGKHRSNDLKQHKDFKPKTTPGISTNSTSKSCPICQSIFNGQSSWRNHIRKFHKPYLLHLDDRIPTGHVCLEGQCLPINQDLEDPRDGEELADVSEESATLPDQGWEHNMEDEVDTESDGDCSDELDQQDEWKSLASRESDQKSSKPKKSCPICRKIYKGQASWRKHVRKLHKPYLLHLDDRIPTGHVCLEGQCLPIQPSNNEDLLDPLVGNGLADVSSPELLATVQDPVSEHNVQDEDEVDSESDGHCSDQLDQHDELKSLASRESGQKSSKPKKSCPICRKIYKGQASWRKHVRKFHKPYLLHLDDRIPTGHVCRKGQCLPIQPSNNDDLVDPIVGNDLAGVSSPEAFATVQDPVSEHNVEDEDEVDTVDSESDEHCSDQLDQHDEWNTVVSRESGQKSSKTRKSCPICQKIFNGQSSWRNHIRKFHKPYLLHLDDRIPTGHVCLEGQCLPIPPEVLATVQNSVSDNNVEDDIDSEPEEHCTDELDQHKQWKPLTFGEPPNFSWTKGCPICQKIYTGRSSWRNHIRKFHNPYLLHLDERVPEGHVCVKGQCLPINEDLADPLPAALATIRDTDSEHNVEHEVDSEPDEQCTDEVEWKPPTSRGPGQNSQSKKCPICGNICRNQSSWRNHIRKFHNSYLLHLDNRVPEGHVCVEGQCLPISKTSIANSNAKSISPKGSKCIICLKTFKTRSAWKSHLERNHRPFIVLEPLNIVNSLTNVSENNVDEQFENTDANPTSLNLKFVQSKRVISSRDYVIFGSSINRRVLMRRPKSHKIHPKVLKTITKFPCKNCSETFRTYNECVDHNTSVHTEGYTCETCGKKVSTLLNLEDHCRVAHIRSESLTCAGCDKSIAKSIEFNHHLKNSTNPECKAKSVECNVCKRYYSTQACLDLHTQMRHVETPPAAYTCSICNKSFYERRLREWHKLAEHSKDNQCDMCGEQFQNFKLLYQHKRRAHKEIKSRKCEHCNKELKGRGAIATHMRLHTNDLPYMCTICGKRFNLRNYLRVHMSSHDPDLQDKNDTRKPKGRKKPKQQTVTEITNPIAGEDSSANEAVLQLLSVSELRFENGTVASKNNPAMEIVTTSELPSIGREIDIFMNQNQLMDV